MRFKWFFRWLGLVLDHATSRFRTSIGQLLLLALGVIVFFGLFYWVSSDILNWLTFEVKPDVLTPPIVNCFYLSVVTFVTLGLGDIYPKCWQSQIFIALEAILGFLFIGLIIPTFLSSGPKRK